MNLIFKERHDHPDNIASFVFTPEEPLEWRAGQFLTYIFSSHDKSGVKNEKRWFTIAAAPYEKNPVLTTRITGSPCKQALNAMQPGEAITASDAKGDFVWQKTELPILFVAGGIGITPFYAMLKDRVHKGLSLNVTLVYANRNENILYKSELDAWQAQHPELTVHYLTGEHVTATRLEELTGDVSSSLVYVSGPEPMVESVGDELRENSHPEAQLKQDFFPGYSELNY